MKAQQSHRCSRDLKSGHKSKMRTRLGLATMFVFSMGIMPAPSIANSGDAGQPSQPSCKDKDCQGQIQRDAEELAREAEELATSVATATRDLVEDFVDRVTDVVRGMPTYEEPEVNENGDIIIRRKPSVDEQGADRLI